MKKTANFEFIFAIRDLELSKIGQEHTLHIARNKGQYFTFNPENLCFHLASLTFWDGFSVLLVEAS